MSASGAQPPPPANDPTAAQRLKVLFLCTHNATRSPMARALCAARFGDRIESASAGVYPGGGVDPRAVAALEEIGVPIEDRTARALSDVERTVGDVCDFDLIVALSRAAYEGAERAARGGPVNLEYWPIDDPTQSDAAAAAHRTVRDALSSRLAERFDGLQKEPRAP